MSNYNTIYRKKPIFYDLFPYKIAFQWFGSYRERKNEIIKNLGYDPKMPTQRLTNDGFLYFKNKKEYNNILKKCSTLIAEVFEPADGYETMLKKDYKFLWHKRFPYAVRFNTYEYFKRESQPNVLDDMSEVAEWCEGNLLGPCQINAASVFVMTMSDATSIKMMFGNYIKEIVQKFTDDEIKKMLKQRCIDADDDLEYFNNG